MKILTVNGLSRSGNHAIIRWIIAQYEDSGFQVFFHNNATKKFLENFNSRGGGGLHGLKIPNPKVIEIIRHLNQDDKKIFIISFEDLIFDEKISQLFEFADLNIIILRDPFNLFSSRIEGLLPPRGRKDSDLSELPDSEIEKYLLQHKEFVGETNFLKNKITISYNSWVLEELYRKKITENDLKIKFTDAKYKQRACSSFGAKAPLELPSEKPEDFLSRYKFYLNDSIFSKVKNKKEFLDISRNLFNMSID